MRRTGAAHEPPAFLDTNVLVYATLQPDQRSKPARALLAQRTVISVQVLNEFANVARRKLHRSWPEIMTALTAVRVLCPSPRPITMGTHDAALAIAARSGYQLYDAQIIASALEAGCRTLFSEDLQDGQVIGGRLTIRDPSK
jgi:predicted nucleic acid-binding protein